MDRDPQVVRRELADAVLGLFDELRREGYAVGVEQYLEAEALLRALADRDEFPDDPHRLGPLLGPIVCKTPMQQEDFCHRFALWVDRLSVSVRMGITVSDQWGAAHWLRREPSRHAERGVMRMPSLASPPGVGW